MQTIAEIGLVILFWITVPPAFVAVLLVLACHTYNRFAGVTLPPAKDAPEESEQAPIEETGPANDGNPYRSPRSVDSPEPLTQEDVAAEGVLPPSWGTAWLMGLGIAAAHVFLMWTVFVPFIISVVICANGLQTSASRGFAVTGIMYLFALTMIVALVVLLAISCAVTGPPPFH